jgi:hypothetical protein
VTAIGFVPSTSGFPFSFIPPTLRTHRHLNATRTRREKPDNLPKRYALVEIGEDWIQKYFHFFYIRILLSHLLAKDLVIKIQSVLNLLKPDRL